MINNISPERVIYTVKEVSQLLHSNLGYTYQLIEVGLLPTIKAGISKGS